MKRVLFIIMLMICCVPVISGALTDGVTIAISFDSDVTNATTTQDMSGIDNNLTAINGVSVDQADAIINQSWLFDGANDRADILHDDTFEQPQMTYKFWFKATGAGGGNAGRFFDSSVANVLVWYYDDVQDNHDIRLVTTWLNPDGNARENIWYMATLTHNTTATKLYINGLLNDTEVGIAGATLDHTIYIGNNIDINRGFKGYLDEMTIWNRSLTASEVAQVYSAESAGYGYRDSWIVPGADALDVGVYAKNTSNHNKTSFHSGEDLYLDAFYFDGMGLSVADGGCNFTLYNGSIKSKSINDNFTICFSGCDNVSYFEVFSPEVSASDFQDMAYMDLCRPFSPVGDFVVNISCASGFQNFTLSPIDIPVCTGTPNPFYFITDACISDASVNIRLELDSGEPLQRVQVTNLALIRFSETNLDLFGVDVYYNATSERYYVDHAYDYYIPSVYPVSVLCTKDGTSVTGGLNVTILNTAPIIVPDIISNSEANVTFGSNITYAISQFNFSFTAIDPQLSWVYFRLDNSSGEVYTQNSSGNFLPSIDSNEFLSFIANPFSITLKAGDTFGEVTTKSYTLYVTDLISPICIGFNDLEAMIGNAVTMSATCYDEALFSLNISCDSGYIFGIQPILSTQYVYSDTQIINESTECSWLVCDAHTLKDISGKYTSLELEDGIKVKVGTKVHTFMSDTKPKSVKTTYKQDRISSKFVYDKKEIPRIFYYTAPKDSIIIDWDLYDGWIVSPSTRTWFDAEIVGIDPLVETKKINDTTFQIVVWSDSLELEFESIGILNCYNGTFNITTVVGGFDEVSIEEMSLPMALFSMFLIFLLFCIIVVAIYFRIGGIVIVASVMMMFVGIFIQITDLHSYLKIIGVALIFISVMFFAVGIRVGLYR